MEDASDDATDEDDALDVASAELDSTLVEVCTEAALVAAELASIDAEDEGAPLLDDDAALAPKRQTSSSTSQNSSEPQSASDAHVATRLVQPCAITAAPASHNKRILPCMPISAFEGAPLYRMPTRLRIR